MLRTSPTLAPPPSTARWILRLPCGCQQLYDWTDGTRITGLLPCGAHYLDAQTSEPREPHTRDPED